MVHFVCGKSANCRTGMAERTFVPRHAGWCRRRNVIGDFAKNTEVGTGMAGGTGAGRDPGMCICQIRIPESEAMADATSSRGRHMIGRHHINTRVGIGMTGRTCRRNPCVRIRRLQRQP